MIAHDVHDTRNAFGVLRDAPDGGLVEEIQVARAGDAQACADVITRLLRGHRRDRATQTDPLLELSQARKRELVLEFRLADEQDLQELVGRRLEVGEQPNLFERVGIEILCLVQDQDGVLARSPTLDQIIIERHQALHTRAFGLTDAVVVQCVLQDLVERQLRIEHEGDSGVGIELLQQRLEKRRLARADLTREHQEALVLLNPVRELGEGFAMPGRQVQELRIRRRVERLFLEAVELEIHRRSYALPRVTIMTS